MPFAVRRPKPLYVETVIAADQELLWELTQLPRHHQRWDARFSRISYLPSADPAAPVRFHYSLGPRRGPRLTGVGTTTAERHRPDGTRVSALRFRADGRLSPLGEGAGYWRYRPGPPGVGFSTGYDYRGWPGPLGTAADRWFVRPAVGWLTAWSFDRLRLWAELGIPPERSRRQAVGELAARGAVVALAAWALGPLPAVPVLAAVLLLPPLPGTPAARRCRRRPSDRTGTRVPAALTTLEAP
ncbi:hypothetical protein [Kitasatospora viridis]|uniref:Polyketide cyclase/dehydrase/lipid transport protein n=1 Tax=Kitasatospora viridis TaxID=281105 RepID=A0A561UED4_9ACTN|nr:hypothetical protein [Kitasatospora viridis]TWF97698.1 hypothetical protein FHX73_111493 [Kitasatospora viridis]